jgi:hypothetical protein
MVQHIRYTGNSKTQIVKERVVEKKVDIETLKAMAREMAKEMVKEIIANMPAQQIIEIRKEGSGGQKNDLIAIDDSVVDVTKECKFKKNFESLGEEKVSEDSGEDKRNKLKELLKKDQKE